MATFSDLVFETHPNTKDGVIAKMEFDNGYGILVERCYSVDEWGAITHYTLGAEENLYQIACTKNGELYFEDPALTGYVGAATEEVITEYMQKIASIKPIVVITDLDPVPDEEIKDEDNVLDYRHDSSFANGSTIGPIET